MRMPAFSTHSAPSISVTRTLAKLFSDTAKPFGAVAVLSREHERFLKVLFDSSAVQKFEDNRKHELSFADACRFWGVTENMKGDQLDRRLEGASAVLFGNVAQAAPR